MRRREFVTLIGVTAAWPIAARAQQSERMRRIGVLTINAEDDPEYRASIAQFVQGLASFGWTEELNSKSTVATPLAMSSACVSSRKNS